jgi:hypothetical protein
MSLADSGLGVHARAPGGLPDLLPRHRDELVKDSGISPAVVEERGAYSVLSADQLLKLGFSQRQSRLTPGIVLPVHGPDGSNGLYVLKPDSPPVDADGKRQKYLQPWKSSPRLDVPPRCRPMLADPSVDAYITEGLKKADAMASHGLCAIALLGVSMLKGKNDFGAPVLLADFDLIAWKGRRVFIVFDSDVMLKKEVQRALERLTAHLTRMGATATPIYLPDDGSGGKVGVDDYLLTHSAEDLKGLVGTSPRLPAPVVELLDEPPLMLGRPLEIVNGRAYGTTWLWTKTTTTTALGDDGKLMIFDPPRVETKRRLFIIRDDGVIFGAGAERSLESLQDDEGIAWRTLDTDFVRDDLVWRTPAVKRYRAGQRPDVASVFERLVGLYDHFMAFERSVADQRSMCEVSALLSLMTWLNDAFDVMPYPWPNGDKGSGKTKWGTLWARTSYLGEVVSAASSFAALRDHAAFGGSLMVDDAEALADPKKCDINVRNLLLSGNRRGTMVALKELDGKRWVTRYVHAYAPRCFTAIRLPDDVLKSRSVVIPLVRSADMTRQRHDPARTDRWPCDRGELLDDLWALGLSLLTEARNIWNELDDDGALADGRQYDCWRAPLAVARLLDRHGVVGLEDRIRSVIAAYQQERQEDQDDDRTAVLIRALLLMMGTSDISDVMTLGDVRDKTLTFSSAGVPDHIKQVVEDGSDIEWATSRRIGRMLARLRLRKAPRQGKRRGWLLTAAEAAELARSYGVVSVAESGTPGTPASESEESPVQTSPMSQTSLMSPGDEPPICESCGKAEVTGTGLLCDGCLDADDDEVPF